jgi:hypothetical protein
MLSVSERLIPISPEKNVRAISYPRIVLTGKSKRQYWSPSTHSAARDRGNFFFA